MSGATIAELIRTAAATVELRRHYASREADQRRTARPPDVADWMQTHFYLPDTGRPIELLPFQVATLRFLLTPDADGRYPYRTCVWSSVKKSGKTAISGGVGQWATETWGNYPRVLCVGNDAKQARGRGFAALQQSVELTPGYQRSDRTLPGRWRLLDNEATSLANGGKALALAVDYAGEAGENPSLTIWTETWAYIHTAEIRFWAEMAPSPTRANSLRWVEGYAGFEGESELLYGLYESAVLHGRHVTAGELAERTNTPLGSFVEAPEPDDLVPIYVNDAAGLAAYWDDGPNARRLPWLQGARGAEYYANEAATQTANQMDRLHSNLWVSAESAFCPVEWWDANFDPALRPVPPGDKTPLVVALDAAVTGDCFGMSAVSRHPERPGDVAVRLSRKWTPPKGGSIDYDGPEAAVREYCATHNVVEVAYDPYQLHNFATRLQKDGVAWFRPFPQGEDRLKADKQLYDLIRDRRIAHDGDPDLREHLQNANAKLSKEADSRVRMVKKAESRKIDLAVCLSMAAAECLRLNL